MEHVAEPTRRAALVLHALSASDREWILRRLPRGASKVLRGLQGELDELGIPGDRALLEQFGTQVQAAHEQRTAQDQAGMSVAQLCRILVPSDPARLAGLLREEPPQLIASFLQLNDWPWREQFVQQLGPLRRKQVTERLTAGADRPMPPRERALNRHLLNRIIERIGESELQPPGPHVAGGPQSRVNSWLRKLCGRLSSRRTA